MEENKFSLKHYLVFLIIPLSSLFYYAKYLKNAETILSFTLYIGISFVFMTVLWKIITLIDSRFDIKKLHVAAITIFAFAAIDQIIKLILHKTGFESKIIGKFFMIKHSHNINQTGITNFLNIETSQTLMIVIKAVMLVAIICLYKLLKSDIAKKGYILFTAGVVATFFDSIFYGYTLDYIHFYGIITYDLKDYYVDAGASALFLIIIINELKKSEEKKKVI